MPAEPLFALLQTRHERIEPAVLQEALLTGAGLPKADAVRAAHRCRGLLAERLTLQQAAVARGSLARQQIETLVVHAAQMITLTPPASCAKPFADELLFLTEAAGVLLVDDVLVCEPGK